MQAQKEAKLNRVLLYYTMLELIEEKLRPVTQMISYGGPKYTDAQAVAAVEAEPTLDLKLVTFNLPNTTLDINEVEWTAGVWYPNVIGTGTGGSPHALWRGGLILYQDVVADTAINIFNEPRDKYVYLGMNQADMLLYVSDGDIKITLASAGKAVYPVGAYSFGTVSKRWGSIFATGINITSNFSPNTDNAQDLGQGPGPFPPKREWRDIWSSRKAYLTQLGRALDANLQTISNRVMDVYTDATRGAAGTRGREIWNSDDNAPNYDDGANWRDAMGNVT